MGDDPVGEFRGDSASEGETGGLAIGITVSSTGIAFQTIAETKSCLRITAQTKRVFLSSIVCSVSL